MNEFVVRWSLERGTIDGFEIEERRRSRKESLKLLSLQKLVLRSNIDVMVSLPHMHAGCTMMNYESSTEPMNIACECCELLGNERILLIYFLFLYPFFLI